MNELIDTLPSDMPLVPSGQDLAPQDRAALAEAVRKLQASRGIVVRTADMLAGVFGSAAGFGLRGLHVPAAITGRAQGIAEAALRRAFDVAVLGMDRTAWLATPGRARIAAAASGALGGFVGAAGFLPDAAFTTLLIMRNIAAIAREEGEDLATEEGRQACLEVFAFGDGEGEADVGYWSARLLLRGRPMMLLFGEVAARYGLRIGEKFAFQLVPLIGAAGGAIVNSVFLDHYRTLARVHFTMRRLERSYGADTVRETAQRLAEEGRLQRRPSGLRALA